MRPTIKLALTFSCAAFAQLPLASGETLRCGAALIQPGDDARYVLEQCGDPDFGFALTAPASAEAINVYHIGAMRADRWRYHRGPGSFPAVLTIADDGRVQAIEFERSRD
jgi:hypothetical protein